jgi:hypothetical protein
LRIGSGQLHASTQSFPEPCILEARDPQASGSAQAKSSSLAQASRLLTLRLKRSAIFFLQLMGQSRRMFLFSRSLFAPLPPGVLCRFSPLIFQPASRSKHTVFFHLICFFSSAEPAILPSLPWPVPQVPSLCIKIHNGVIFFRGPNKPSLHPSP